MAADGKQRPWQRMATGPLYSILLVMLKARLGHKFTLLYVARSSTVMAADGQEQPWQLMATGPLYPILQLARVPVGNLAMKQTWFEGDGNTTILI